MKDGTSTAAQPTTILVAAANPSNTDEIAIRVEMDRIQTALSISTSGSKSFDVQLSPATTFKGLRRTMLRIRPQIVHFSGHGQVSGLFFEDAMQRSHEIPNKTLVSFFEEFNDDLLCVIFASCYSSRLARSLSKYIDFVVGVPGNLPDSAALAFSEAFYEALGANQPIDKAFRFGKNAVSAETSRTSGLPQLLTAGKSIVRSSRGASGEDREAEARKLLDFAQEQAGETWTGLNRMAAQADNLLGAFFVFADEAKWQEMINFRRPLTDFLHSVGRHKDAIRVGELSFEAAENLKNNLEMAWSSIYPLSREYFHLRKLTEAMRWAERGQLLFKREDCRDGEAAALRYMGRILQAQGNVVEAKDCYNEAVRVLQSAKRARNDSGIRVLRGHLRAANGAIELLAGNLPAAKQAYQSALTDYSRADDSVGVAWMHSQLAQVERAATKPSKALQLLERAEREISSCKAPLKEAEVLLMLAVLRLEIGDQSGSLVAATRARDIFQYTDDAASLREAKSIVDRLTRSVGEDGE